MLLKTIAACLLVAIFGFSWSQASSAGYLWNQEQRNTIPGTYTFMAGPINQQIGYRYGPTTPTENMFPSNLNNDQSYLRRFRFNEERDHMPRFTSSYIDTPDRLTLTEAAAVMPLIINEMQSVLSQLKIQSEDLENVLNMIIVKDQITTFQRVIRKTDQRYQYQFIDLLGSARVHKSNIANAQGLLDSYKSVQVWDTLIQDNNVVNELKNCRERVYFLFRRNGELWREFFRILSL